MRPRKSSPRPDPKPRTRNPDEAPRHAKARDPETAERLCRELVIAAEAFRSIIKTSPGEIIESDEAAAGLITAIGILVAATSFPGDRRALCNEFAARLGHEIEWFQNHPEAVTELLEGLGCARAAKH
jgi:hypothetical protein